MTFSIVARDPDTGQLGVAVETCMFGVGRIVPWAVAGVGAVATQAMAEPAYGPWCLDAMSSGASAAEALATARELDPIDALRQVGVVDAGGGADAFTGDLRLEHAGYIVGDGWTVQANLMATPDVWPAMADAYQSSSGPLGERLLATLRAGEVAGGDARGRMSAAMLIVDGTRQPEPWQGRLIDVRVDHDLDDPIGELERLYHGAVAYDAFSSGVDAMTAGDAPGALRETKAGLELLPDDVNLLFLNAGALMASGDTKGGVERMRMLLAERPSFARVVRSFAALGFVSVPPEVDLDALLAESS
jgi:uncharacterized Ntn-hydrolase superfamily protein